MNPDQLTPNQISLGPVNITGTLPSGNPITVFSTSPDQAFYLPAAAMKAIFPTSTEIINRKNAVSKTFQTGQNQYSVVINRAPVHYKDSNGNWQDINLSIIQNKDGTLTMSTAPYSIKIFTDRVGYSYTDADGSTFSMELVQINGQPINNSLLSTQLDTCQVFFNGMSPGISFKILLLAQQPKMCTMLNTAGTATSFTWQINQSIPYTFLSSGFDENGDNIEVLVSQIQSSPTLTLYTETFTGRVSRMTNVKTRQLAWFNNPVYPIIIDPTITKNISTANDDGNSYFAWSNAGDTFNFSGTTFKVSAGFRWQNVAIPNGSTVNSATFKIKVKSASHVWVLGIKGNKVPSAAIWTTADGPNHMIKTTAVKSWTPTGGGAVNSVDVTTVIAEIIGQGGWGSGNNLKIAVQSRISGGPDGQSFSDYEHSPANAASLIINFTPPAGTTIYNMLPGMSF